MPTVAMIIIVPTEFAEDCLCCGQIKGQKVLDPGTGTGVLPRNMYGYGETKQPINVSDELYKSFEPTYHEEYNVEIPFTRESRNGRMKACRGIGASLSSKEIANWETEHKKTVRKHCAHGLPCKALYFHAGIET